MGHATKTFGNVSISLGNTKLGTIPNVSLPPVIACSPKIPCAEKCYARKAFRQYAAVRNAWGRNWKVIQKDPDEFFRSVIDYLEHSAPPLFRWWVSGDTPNQQCLDQIYRTAKMCPKTRYLLFTKRHDLIYRKRPDNLAIMFSMWPQFGNTTKHVRRAWVRSKAIPDKRVPRNAIACPGHCETCGMCWDIDNLGRDVVFELH